MPFWAEWRTTLFLPALPQLSPDSELSPLSSPCHHRDYGSIVKIGSAVPDSLASPQAHLLHCDKHIQVLAKCFILVMRRELHAIFESFLKVYNNGEVYD